VSYINWACDCADFIPADFWNNDTIQEVHESDCIFIEPANPENAVPDEFYSSLHFNQSLQLVGRYYNKKGIPKGYSSKTPVKPSKAPVFQYTSFSFIPKEPLSDNYQPLLGSWVHEQDVNAQLFISDTSWTFNYVGHEYNSVDTYHYSLTHSLPNYASTSGDFIVLANLNDTLYYELMNLNDQHLSLLHFPSGKIHQYIKKTQH
jgi:hypothetical protein